MMTTGHIKWAVGYDPSSREDTDYLKRSKVRAAAYNQTVNQIVRIRDPRNHPDVAPLTDDGYRNFEGYYRLVINELWDRDGVMLANHLNIRAIFRLVVSLPDLDAHRYQLWDGDLVPDGSHYSRVIEMVAVRHRQTAYDPDVAKRIRLIGSYPRLPQNF